MKAGRAPYFPPNYVTLKQLHDQRLKEKQEAEERLRKEKEEEEERLRKLKELEAEAEAERRRIQRREEEENLRKSAIPRSKSAYRRRRPVPALAPIATAEAAKKPASGGPDPNSLENLEEESIVRKSRGFHGSKKSYRPRRRTPVAPPAEPAVGALDCDPGAGEEALDGDPGAGEEANQLEMKERKKKFKKKQKKGKAVEKKPEEAIDSKQVVPVGEPGRAVEIVVEEFGVLTVNGGNEIPDEEKNGERVEGERKPMAGRGHRRNPRFGGFGEFSRRGRAGFGRGGGERMVWVRKTMGS